MRPALAAVAAAAVVLAGCASTTSGTGTGPSPAMLRALLTTSEVGSGFQQTKPDTTSKPPPCQPHAKPLDERFDNVKARVAFARADNKVALDEEIIDYHSVATAQRALAAGEKGLSCRHAKIQLGTSTQQAVISAPTDATRAFSTRPDKAEVWLVAVSGYKLALLVARFTRYLLVLSFTADASLTNTELPDTQQIANTALAKAKQI